MNDPRSSSRRNYTLLIGSEGAQSRFDAVDTAEALQHVLAVLPKGSSAKLVADGVTLAEINHSSDGFWTVSGRAAEGT